MMRKSLALVLPVATVFSKIKLIKTYLRNRMGEEYLCDALICAIERETFDKVKEKDSCRIERIIARTIGVWFHYSKRIFVGQLFIIIIIILSKSHQ
ncbi:hypothetical protein HanXRQr2_Chr09g0410011 [Helianthus annuus]|uniref:Uncharacterized protein n=1 Tax=Helianthus annuus TaxID=4232 RepID=A0A251TZX3_HELAN|nr:hypothetical protein HanXRQr2_Chr09g0410011 [Helianthus annuus]KAJ0895055.1 hypothetical protein HanPSC8_Chr09g0396051 [Helianthus annuus]